MFRQENTKESVFVAKFALPTTRDQMLELIKECDTLSSLAAALIMMLKVTRKDTISFLEKQVELYAKKMTPGSVSTLTRGDAPELESAFRAMDLSEPQKMLDAATGKLNASIKALGFLQTSETLSADEKTTLETYQKEFLRSRVLSALFEKVLSKVKVGARQEHKQEIKA